MNTPSQEKHARQEKYRRQEYYQHALDEQNGYRSRKKQQPLREDHRSERDKNQLYHNRQSFPGANYDNQGHLPPLKVQNKQSSRPEGLLALRQRGEEDKTQIYLKNCEYIIKNLRQLKQKKEKDQFPTLSTQQDEREKQFSSKQDFQYYPKNQYFSSQGKAYNKLYPAEMSQKYGSNVKKLQEDDFYKSYEYDSPINRSSIRVKSLPRKVIKNITMNKYEVEYPNNYRSERSVADSEQSEIPSGFEDKMKEAKQYRRLSSSKNSERSTPKLAKKTEDKDKPRNKDIQVEQKDSRKQKQSQERQQQNLKVQRELVSCLSQLTQFLRNQNQNVNRQPAQQSLHHPQNQRETRSDKNDIPRQQQIENFPENTQALPNQHQLRAETLKEKAIVALKKLNEKSKGFVQLASNRNPQNKNKQEPEVGRKRPSVKFIEQVEHIPPRQQQTKTNPQNADEDKALKPIISRPVNIVTSQNPSTSRLTASHRKLDQLKQSKVTIQKQVQPESKVESLNSELAKQLISYLQKQQNQNVELSFCLKQLTQFLKIQNDEMVELKTRRKEEIRKTLSPQKPSREREEIQEESEEEEAGKGKTAKLQEAVLKKLKKARLRGSIFKEKVEKFRKEHHLVITRRQPPKQEQKEVEIQPVTNNKEQSNERGENAGQEQTQNQLSPVNRQKQLGVQDNNMP